MATCEITMVSVVRDEITKVIMATREITTAVLATGEIIRLHDFSAPI